MSEPSETRGFPDEELNLKSLRLRLATTREARDAALADVAKLREALVNIRDHGGGCFPTTDRTMCAHCVAVAALAETKPAESFNAKATRVFEATMAKIHGAPTSPETHPCPKVSHNGSWPCEKEAGHEGLCSSQGDGFHGRVPETHPEYLRGLEDAAKVADKGKRDEWSPDLIALRIRALAEKDAKK